MLAHLRPSGERIVIVSNSTEVLSLIEKLCLERAVRFEFSVLHCLKTASTATTLHGQELCL